jgi:xylulokinase
MKYLLGVDVGTNGAKSVLFTEEGELIDTSYHGYGVHYPREGWVEQSAEDWWIGLRNSVRELLSRNDVGDRVAALSLSAQGGATVLLGSRFRPLRAAVSWLDIRARETQDLLEREITAGELQEICGWNLLFALCLPVVFWFRHTNPGLFRRVRHVATTVDYINHRLTGRFAIDPSNCAMTELLDLERGDWSDRLLDLAGLKRHQVPEIVPSGESLGRLTPEAAEELSLPPEVIVISGAHDQYCANIGAGAVKEGDCVLSSGTAWVMLATSDTLLRDAKGLIHPGPHLLKGKFGLMTAVSSAGDSLNWFWSTFESHTSLDQLSDEVKKVRPGSDGMVFIPKFTSKSQRASFLNVDTAHDRMHFARSVFEGVALANRRHIEAFREIGMRIENLIMIGGGARSSAWPGIVSDVSGLPVYLPEQRESACAGAAVLAGVGSGLFPSIEGAVARFTGKKKLIEPDRRHAAVYESAYERFVSALEHV